MSREIRKFTYTDLVLIIQGKASVSQLTIPPDAKLISMWSDYGTEKVDIVFEHDSFRYAAPGASLLAEWPEIIK